MDYFKAFVVGGIICVIAQILMDKTKITPGRILVLFVCGGAVLGGMGIYEPLVKYAGAGATVPLPGFGYLLSKGVMKEIDQNGIVGVLSGGLKSTATGITAAIMFGLLAAVLFDSKDKG